MEISFKDYIVLVTGAASGMGLETSRQFINNGAVVVALDYSEKNLEKAARELGDKYIAKFCDISSEKSIIEIAQYVKDAHGRLDCLINNAGRVRFGIAFETMKEEDFYWHYDVIVKGPMLLCKHLIPLLRKSSHASIVNITSTVTEQEISNHFMYSTAKTAMQKFTRHLARDLPGIRANSILPGWTDTPMGESIGSREQVEAVFKMLLPRIPCRRVAQPIDIANCVLFLCSDKASYITGAAVAVDGGFMVAPDWGV
ncbi:MAG: SDR family oxidoreductase [Syntrophaceae bacterium]